MLEYTRPIAFQTYIARYDTYPGQFRGTIGEEMQGKHFIREGNSYLRLLVHSLML